MCYQLEMALNVCSLDPLPPPSNRDLVTRLHWSEEGPSCLMLFLASASTSLDTLHCQSVPRSVSWFSWLNRPISITIILKRFCLIFLSVATTYEGLVCSWYIKNNNLVRFRKSNKGLSLKYMVKLIYLS